MSPILLVANATRLLITTRGMTMTSPFRMMPLLLMVHLCITVAAPSGQDSLDTDQGQALNVFLDCWSCDDSFIRTEITYINYVRDRLQADVHILVTRQRTGSRGNEYTLTFIGQKRYTGVNDTLVYVSPESDTRDDTRRGMVTALKNGLFRYVLHTPQGRFLSTRYSRTTGAQDTEDPWDYWFFRVNANAFTHGEASSQSFNGRLGVSANRTTLDWKVRISADTDYGVDVFEYDNAGVTVEESFIRRYHEIEAEIVGSIDEHWSAGGEIEASSSTYRNIELALVVAPGIEYNYFPYTESTRRMLTARYQIGVVMNSYVQTTIYGHIRETRPAHELRLAVDLRQPWGSTHVSVTGLQYLHDLGRYNIRISGDVNVRIFEGLALNLHGSYSQIRDQLSLPAGGASQSEVLTRQREIATNFSYFTSVGLSYSFGSIYNNIVNPRM